jgi:hypothetical protein
LTKMIGLFDGLRLREQADRENHKDKANLFHICYV